MTSPRRSTTAFCACVVALAACGGSAAPPRATAAPMPPISYTELAELTAPPADHREAYGDHPLQFGELRLPDGDARVPVVIFVHGGCWQAAYDLAHTRPAAEALAQSGYAVWSIEYRRVGDVGGGFPNTFADVARGVDHVRTLAQRFARLDTTRVVLAGHSAGGQLVLWAAARDAGDVLGETAVAAAPLRPVGVVSLAGIADLRAYGAERGSCNASVTPLLGGTPAEVPARYAAVSPIERPPARVPVRAVHGAEDPIVPVAQSEALVRVVREAGGSAELAVVAGAGHFDVVAPGGPAWDAVLGAVRALVTAR